MLAMQQIRMPPVRSSVQCDLRRPPLLHETVIDQLRDLIVQGELAPETKLNERVLAERLGTSRTPLREAIKFLASEGLVELLPNRGAVVAPLKPEKMKEVFVVLGALEALAGDLACRNATEEDIADIRGLHFHMLAAPRARRTGAYFAHNQQIHRRIIDCRRQRHAGAYLAASMRTSNESVTWPTCRANAGTRRCMNTAKSLMR